jgi:hypothetical protein
MVLNSVLFLNYINAPVKFQNDISNTLFMKKIERPITLKYARESYGSNTLRFAYM